MTEYVIPKIKNVLEREIAAALGQSYMITQVEILDMNMEGESYSVNGSYKVLPLLAYSPIRKGKFNTKLDMNLKVVSLKIQEETR